MAHGIKLILLAFQEKKKRKLAKILKLNKLFTNSHKN